MKASEIVQAMIDGLEKEWVKVDMSTFGDITMNTCYGCAATNNICELVNKKPSIVEFENYIKIWSNYSKDELFIKSTFLRNFEVAINSR